MNSRPSVTITDAMMAEAERLVAQTQLTRTRATEYDALVGNLGELAFAEYFFGDFRRHQLGKNRGQEDFPGLEIKTSAYPFREWLHLKVREDYAEKRRPAFYVQTIIDVPDPTARPAARMTVILCGFCPGAELMTIGRLKPQKRKDGTAAGYRCWEVPIRLLHSMEGFGVRYKKFLTDSSSPETD